MTWCETCDKIEIKALAKLNHWSLDGRFEILCPDCGLMLVYEDGEFVCKYKHPNLGGHPQ